MDRKETLYKDFSARLQPTQVWDSAGYGTAIRSVDSKGRVVYKAKPAIKPKSGTRKLTEAEDNAIGRAHRRRQNKHLRGWRPYAQR